MTGGVWRSPGELRGGQRGRFGTVAGKVRGGSGECSGKVQDGSGKVREIHGGATARTFYGHLYGILIIHQLEPFSELAIMEYSIGNMCKWFGGYGNWCSRPGRQYVLHNIINISLEICINVFNMSIFH